MILRPLPSKADESFARRTRLKVSRSAVTVTSSSGTTEITGIAEVVRLPSSDERPLGSLQLRSSDGTVLLNLDTAAWTHGLRAGARFVQPLDPCGSPATYLANLIAGALRVSVRTVQQSAPPPPNAAIRPASPPVPLILWAYVLAPAGLLALILGIFSYAISDVVGQVVTLLVAVSTAVAAVFVAITWYQWLVPPVRSAHLDDAFRPRPGAPVQRAFARRARLGRVGSEFVVVDADGTGRWFGGPDEHGARDPDRRAGSRGRAAHLAADGGHRGRGCHTDHRLVRRRAGVRTAAAASNMTSTAIAPPIPVEEPHA